MESDKTVIITPFYELKTNSTKFNGLYELMKNNKSILEFVHGAKKWNIEYIKRLWQTSKDDFAKKNYKYLHFLIQIKDNTTTQVSTKKTLVGYIGTHPYFNYSQVKIFLGSEYQGNGNAKKAIYFRNIRVGKVKNVVYYKIIE